METRDIIFGIVMSIVETAYYMMGGRKQFVFFILIIIGLLVYGALIR